jgi:hypothetical protein
MRAPRPLLLLALLAAGCATYTTLSPEARTRIERQFTAGSEPRYLRESLYVTPFFGDATRRLLTSVPPEDVRMLEDLSGKPIHPGPVQTVAAAGSRVRVRKVEFPTAFTVAERVLVTPRTHPWAYLDVEGVGGETPLILVVPAEGRSEAEVVADLERYLTTQDIRATLASFPAAVREAIATKRAVPGMSAEALRMAWGLPSRVQRDFRDGSRVEEWTFPGGRRKAVLVEDRVTEVVDPHPPEGPRT